MRERSVWSVEGVFFVCVRSVWWVGTGVRVSLRLHLRQRSIARSAIFKGR